MGGGGGEGDGEQNIYDQSVGRLYPFLVGCRLQKKCQNSNL